MFSVKVVISSEVHKFGIQYLINCLRDFDKIIDVYSIQMLNELIIFSVSWVEVKVIHKMS